MVNSFIICLKNFKDLKKNPFYRKVFLHLILVYNKDKEILVKHDCAGVLIVKISINNVTVLKAENIYTINTINTETY